MKQVYNCCKNVKFTWMDGTQMIIVDEHLVISKYIYYFTNLGHQCIGLRGKNT
jgi:hypothetical protein